MVNQYQQKISEIDEQTTAIAEFEQLIIAEGGPHTPVGTLIHGYCSVIRDILNEERDLYKGAIIAARDTPDLTVEQAVDERLQGWPQFGKWESLETRHKRSSALRDRLTEDKDTMLWNLSD